MRNASWKTGARAAALGLVAAVALPLGAQATTINLSASMDGAQANAGAGTGSLGTGSASITFDDVTKLLSWSGSFSGLTGDYTVSHFHGPALPNQNAGVQVGIPVVPDPGLKSGSFAGSSPLSASQEADLLAGLWYVNIHSTVNPGGEIRGQVIPEPTTALLLATGLAGIAVAGRRRSRQ